MKILIKNFLFFNKEDKKNNSELIERISECETTAQEMNLYEVKLNKIFYKLDSLAVLALKIKLENEKTNSVMVCQENNLKEIDTLIQKQINIIDKLSEDINLYKINLDENMRNFKANKEKLFNIVKFIKEIKQYIQDIETSSNDMRTKSDSILNISKTIKKYLTIAKC